MSLQILVNHFNEKLAQEQGFEFHPFVLDENKVSGLWGKNRLNTVLNPIRCATNSQLIVAHAAQLIVTSHFFHRRPLLDIENLLSCESGEQLTHFSLITNFDRLCRTVHLLNSLAVSDTDSLLFLEVDPRHIIGVKYDHGAYFEEIIIHCGLRTKNVVISLAASGIHEEHHNHLLQGLNNYRDCGYKIALNLGHFISSDRALSLIQQLNPDYVSLTAPNENDANLNVSLTRALHHLKEWVSSLGGQLIFQEVRQTEQALTAIEIGLDLVQGIYYEKSPNAGLSLVKHKHKLRDYSDSD